MRIRYGKPVKVKSLLGRCNIPYTYDFENVTFYPLSSGTFIRYAEDNQDLVKIERKANHNYFILLNAEIETYSWSYFGIWDTYSTGYDGNRAAPTKDGNNYYALITPTTSVAEGIPTLQFGVTTKNTGNYAVIIDLTELGLDHLTAEQFYNKYKNKFESIATGKEVLLDNGSGKISYSEKIVLKSLWGDQSNLTAVEPTQSGEYIYLGKGGYATQSTYNINTNLEDFNTPILNGHKYILVAYTNAYAAFHMLSTSGSDKWEWTDGVGDFIPNQLKYSYYTATEDIILKNFYQGGSHTSTLTKDFFIDLTSTFGVGNEPTAQEFYDRYKGYFLDLTTGKEITLGIGKIAGGSSDVYYGYNQRVIPNDTTTHNSNDYSYDPNTNTFTLTANSSTTTYYFGLTCEQLTGMAGHKVLFIGNVTEVSTAAPFTDITGEWAMTSVTDRQSATGVGLTYCIGEWRDVTTTYINITTSTNFTVGDYFKIKDVQIIDLTEWFGAGKEPTTVEEFREKFTKEYYPYLSTLIKMTQKQIEEPWYGYNQLIKNGNFVDASSWNTTAGAVLAIENNTAILTATSLGTHDFAVSQNIGDLNANDKYIILFDAKTNSTATKMLNMYLSAGYVSETTITLLPTVWNSIGKIFSYETSKTAVTAYFGKIATLSGYWANGDVIYFKNINIINLTEWYGPGNEPATVEEFRKTFPNKYYPYSQKQVLNRYMINKKVLN